MLEYIFFFYQLVFEHYNVQLRMSMLLLYLCLLRGKVSGRVLSVGTKEGSCVPLQTRGASTMVSPGFREQNNLNISLQVGKTYYGNCGQLPTQCSFLSFFVTNRTLALFKWALSLSRKYHFPSLS